MNTSKAVVGAGKLQHHIASSQNRLLVKGGTLFYEDKTVKADIYAEDGIIKEVGTGLSVPGGIRVVDAKGKFVFPGGIDADTHFQYSHSGITVHDDFYIGSKKCLAGGSTTFLDYIIPNEGENLIAAFDRTMDLMNQKACCDFALKCVVREFTDRTLNDVTTLVQKGVSIFHVSNEYSRNLSDDQLKSLMSHLSGKNCLLSASAFDKAAYYSAIDEKTTVDNYLEKYDPAKDKEYVMKLLQMSKATSCRIIFVDVISEEVANIIDSSNYIMVTSSHITMENPLNKGDLKSKLSKFTLPPLLNGENRKKMVGYLSRNLSNLMVVSSHRGFKDDQKSSTAQNVKSLVPGCGGAVERLSVLWDATQSKTSPICDPNQYVRYVSTNPAVMMNIFPKKGTFRVGSDADIVIWDAELKRNLGVEDQIQLTSSAFQGVLATGSPHIIVANGKVVYDEDARLRFSQGSGRFIPIHYANATSNGDSAPPAVASEPVKPVPTEEKVADSKATTTQVQDAVANQKNDLTKAPNNTYHSSIKIHNPPGGKSSGIW